MPIKAENRALYPGGSPTSPEWKELRERILEREGNACKWCKAPNGEIILRSADGNEYATSKDWASGELTLWSAENGRLLCPCGPWTDLDFGDNMPVQIVLTIAHLDQDPTNNPDDNLAALCQRCHNRHDAPHRAKNAAKTRHAKKASADLFEGAA